MVTREEIVQYCLNNGTGIVYSDSDGAETTESEKKEKCIRYVSKDTIDWFERHLHPEQVEYAVKNNISLLDFDEWQAIQAVLFANTADPNQTISYKCALAMNCALWEYEDISPMDLE